MLCGSLRCAWFAEYGCHAFVSLQLCFSCRAAWQDGGEMVAEVIDVHLVGDEFGNDFFACHEIDERDVGYLQHQTAKEADEASCFGVIAYDLWHSEEGCLEGCCSAGDEGCCAVLQKAVGLVADDAYIEPGGCLGVELVAEPRCGGKHELVVFGKGFCGFCHAPEVVADFLFSASCKQGDDGFACECCFGVCVFAEGCHFVDGWVAYVVDGIMVFVFVEIDFEG